jgi:hypothetical protein
MKKIYKCCLPVPNPETLIGRKDNTLATDTTRITSLYLIKSSTEPAIIHDA